MKNFNRKVAIVTGGTSGIGLAVAQQFLKEGARVVIAARDDEAFPKITKLLPKALCLKTDVTEEGDIKRLVQTAIKRFGALDIVVNSAGIALDKSTKETGAADFRKTMDTNLTGSFLMTKYAMPHLIKTRGTVVNIASKLGLIPDPEVPAYCISKAAVVMMTKVHALEYAKAGVRVNCVCPGPTDTPLLRSYFKARSQMAAYYKKHSPVGRVGTPAEVARVVLFLASPESSYLTGGIYSVDGGGSLIN